MKTTKIFTKQYNRFLKSHFENFIPFPLRKSVLTAGTGTLPRAVVSKLHCGETDPPKYVAFFKGRDADAVAQAFKEFVYGNEKRKGRTSVRENLKRFRNAVSQKKNRERSREKNKDRV